MAETSGLPEVGEKLVAVQIREQRFAVDIMQVREIRGWTTSTPLAGAPDHVLGMINLRGAVLPVIDLGARLRLGATEQTSSSVVVVAQVGERQVGLLVDAVCDILTVQEDEVQAVPTVGTDEVQDFVRAVMTTDEGIVSSPVGRSRRHEHRPHGGMSRGPRGSNSSGPPSGTCSWTSWTGRVRFDMNSLRSSFRSLRKRPSGGRRRQREARRPTWPLVVKSWRSGTDLLRFMSGPPGSFGISAVRRMLWRPRRCSFSIACC